MTRFGHVGLCARDWQKLVTFYVQVFGCEPVGPERDLAGEWLANGCGIPGVKIRGQHLRLPGHGTEAPTLEVFSYEPALPAGTPMPNRVGYGHICFQVDSVDEALLRVVTAGGDKFGEPVTAEIPGAGMLQFVYCRDPEGNVLELQRWD